MRPFIRHITIILILYFAAPQFASGQSQVDSLRVIEYDDIIVMKAKIEGRDTTIMIDLEPVQITSFPFPNTRYYRKLVYNTKKVYPYAKLAAIKLNQYEEILEETKNKRKRKKIMKRAEDDIMDEFGEELKSLTTSQGKILIKLLDRETGKNSYEIVKNLRGRFRAFFYQTVGRLFGYDLKERYDPKGKDKDIETIVNMIESGVL
jgi:hypothetical protein